MAAGPAPPTAIASVRANLDRERTVVVVRFIRENELRGARAAVGDGDYDRVGLLQFPFAEHGSQPRRTSRCVCACCREKLFRNTASIGRLVNAQKCAKRRIIRVDHELERRDIWTCLNTIVTTGQMIEMSLPRYSLT